MAAEIVTIEDLERFRIRLLGDFAKLMQQPDTVQPLLRSGEVRKMLNISPGTLQKLRVKGILPFVKLDGSFRYRLVDVERAMQAMN